MKLRRGGTCRDRVWAAACELREFRVAELASLAEVPEDTTRYYLRRWRRAGLIEASVPWAPGTHIGGIYSLTGDPGDRPPDAAADVSAGVRTRMWQSMRVLRRLTVPDVAATAAVSIDRAQHFVRVLHRIGYLRRLRRSTGRPGGHAVYLLVRDTGPSPVRIGQRGIYDPNTREYIPWNREDTQ